MDQLSLGPHWIYLNMPLKLIFLLVLAVNSYGQTIARFETFEARNKDLYWQMAFDCGGKRDSVRAAVVQMLKSKFFTFNVIRNEVGYNGELKHYRIDCKRYGRSYLNTPRMFWDGEWIGKFVVEVFDGRYTVKVYAMYYESVAPSTDYYKTEKPVKGRLFDAVMRKDGVTFKKNQQAHLALLGQSLRDSFSLPFE